MRKRVDEHSLHFTPNQLGRDENVQIVRIAKKVVAAAAVGHVPSAKLRERCVSVRANRAG